MEPGTRLEIFRILIHENPLVFASRALGSLSLCTASCPRASLNWKHWFSEICVHETMRVKRGTTVHYYDDNGFDHAYPLQGSQEPAENSGPLSEKQWANPMSKKFTPTEHKYSFIHSTSIPWAPAMCQQLCWVPRIPQQTEPSPAFAQLPFSWRRQTTGKQRSTCAL